MTPGVRSCRIEAVGLSTRVLEAGPAGQDEAVVMLHGSPGSADAWSDLLPRVGEFARAVAFDLPGFGEASRPAGWEYSPHAYSLFLAGVLAELGIRRAHLVMSDVGGSAVLWAVAHPEAFASAVLIDSGVLIGFRWHAVAKLHRSPVVGALMPRLGRAGFGSVFRAAEPGLPRAVVREWRRGWDAGTRRAMLRFYRATPASAFARLAPALRRLDRPALVLWGARDRFVPVEQAERQRESFPRARVVVFEDRGHYLHVEDPERVAAEAVPFLREQVGA